ncbi:MAG: hypothetical protein ACRER1_07455 [Gammaproteobacteria bacterium]
MRKILITIGLLLAAHSTAWAAGSAPIAADFHIGPWKLGMTKSEVASFNTFGPYEPVTETGGLETKNGVFQDKKSDISFVFDKNGLQYIQVWAYEGKSYEQTKKATLALYDLFEKSFGGATVGNVAVKNPDGSTNVSRASMAVILDRVLGTARQLSNEMKKKGDVINIMFDLIPAKQPSGSQLDVQFSYSARYGTFYVFLFQDRAGIPPRRVKSNLYAEKP